MCSDNAEHHANRDSQELSKDNHGRTIPERIAEFVLYSIFVFGDVHYLWENHRIISLVFAVAGLGCLLVLDRGFSRKTIIGTLAGASVIAIAIYCAVPKALIPDVEVSGTLQPGHEPTPANACDSGRPDRLKILGLQGIEWVVLGDHSGGSGCG
jgi:hypothetical protein